MKYNWAALGCVICTFSNCLNANAGASRTTLLDDTHAGVAGGISILPSEPWAQQFAVPNDNKNYQVSEVTLRYVTDLFNAGAPAASLSIWSAGPNGPVTELGFLGSQRIDHEGDFTFTAPAGLVLSAGESYCIQFGALNGSWFLSGSLPEDSTGLGTFGNMFEAKNGNWQLGQTSGMVATMVMTVEQVPEPSGSALLGFGVLALAVAHRTTRPRVSN